MRATISFEVDVERVQETMTALVLQEAVPLHQAMELVETAEPQDLYDGITQALEILGSVSTQLQQYRSMLVSFEKSRFETLLPQPAEQVAIPVQDGRFEHFLGRIGNEKENSDDVESEEG